MLQLIGLFGVICGVFGALRIARHGGYAESLAKKAGRPVDAELLSKAKSSGIAIVVVAAVLLVLSVFGAPLAMSLSGL